MANTLIPVEERNLNPGEIERLDQRRRRGFVFQVVSVQFAIISSILLLWIGQDWTYAPGWAHPMDYYFVLAVGICLVCGLIGLTLRSGAPEF